MQEEVFPLPLLYLMAVCVTSSFMQEMETEISTEISIQIVLPDRRELKWWLRRAARLKSILDNVLPRKMA